MRASDENFRRDEIPVEPNRAERDASPFCSWPLL